MRKYIIVEKTQNDIFFFEYPSLDLAKNRVETFGNNRNLIIWEVANTYIPKTTHKTVWESE